MGGIARLNNDAADVSKVVKHIEKKALHSPHAIVLVWADWCGHCIAMRPQWDSMVTSVLSSAKGINAEFAEIESRHLDAVKQLAQPLHQAIVSVGEGRVSFPTILMFKKGRVDRVYQDQRNAPTMAKVFTDFATKNTPPQSKRVVTRQTQAGLKNLNKVKNNGQNTKGQTGTKGKKAPTKASTKSNTTSSAKPRQRKSTQVNASQSKSTQNKKN